MAFTLLLQLLLVSLASASHHYGGTATLTYRGMNSDGSFEMDFRYRNTFDTCLYEHSWSCVGGQCGFVSLQKRNYLDSSRNAPPFESFWCETETVERLNIPRNNPFELWEDSCCWISTRNSVIGWKLLTYVDLGTRSDTREPNRSPDIAIVPFLRVPYNCPRTYKLVNFDPDGDKVRCRYGNFRDRECSRCDRPSGFSLDQDSCTLQYNHGSYNRRIYAFEMVVEDVPRSLITVAYSDGSQAYKGPAMKRRKRQLFSNWLTTTPTSTSTTTSSPILIPSPYITSTTTTTTTRTTTAPYHHHHHHPYPYKPYYPSNPYPRQYPYHGTTLVTTTTSTPPPPIQAPSLSKLPLHFSLLVDQYVPSCELGQYLPKFLYPTPENGVHIQAEVNKEMEIRIKAEALISRIQNVVYSGPQGITKRHIFNNEFAIEWTPGPDDLGQHYVICFVVESKAGSRNYQSDMRCVIVDVKHRIVEANVICSQSEMRVEVDKSTFPRLSEDHLRLSDPSNVVCSLKTHSNSTHVIAVFPLNACGTQIEEDDDYLRFKNEISTFDNVKDVITRKHLLEVQFYCQYPKRGNVTQSFRAHRNRTTVWEKGMGKFTYHFEFFRNALFQTEFDPNSYPLEFDLGRRIYMQIQATSSVNNTELFVESCRAAPYDNPNSKPVYTITEDGCIVDQTVQIHRPDHLMQFRFSVEAFKFIGLHNQVYITCSVLVCRAGNSNTRCSQGCIASPPPPLPPAFGRRKRAVVTQSSLHHISQGPLCSQRPKRSLSPEIDVNLNVIFIAGCLLAAVGVISGAAVYVVKISKMKYQPLPTQES